MEHYIFYVAEGETEELRWTLRSLAKHAPEGRVTVIGSVPSWVDQSKITLLPGNLKGERFANSYDNIRIASQFEPGDFWTFNDDFLSLQDWPDPFPVWYWRSISEHMDTNMKDPKSLPRKALFRRTRDYLRWKGIEEPMHYEVHIPMRINGTEMLRILDEAASEEVPEEFRITERTPPIWRTLYGNLSTLPSEPHIQRQDVKHHGLYTIERDAGGLANLDFLSTDERSFRRIQPLVAEMFPDKSPWEK
ncbi:hypothetical protein QEH42_gp238 [Microbacterium phage Pumpernickel]|uniref:Uncharacterized protein n=1 Tax=Microbacterium phage Pumpernickel TaxID=2885983 RepID=A0AAE8Y7B1_9CAUD|nr:hypothetical protein QEH42_gp238 [Microbacterium phage Pumpernickel]UDL15980.1 hypothetical protein SEA_PUMPERNICKEL_230 [Microbacterium phage Pumpernickel]